MMEALVCHPLGKSRATTPRGRNTGGEMKRLMLPLQILSKSACNFRDEHNDLGYVSLPPYTTSTKPDTL